MTVKTLAIIQARMSSSRLPGKVLMDICGKPLLQHMLERVSGAKTLDGVLLATTTDPSDDILADFCTRQALPCFRGSLPDVLDRFYRAAREYHADVIVRLTADCPLIDPRLLDLTVATFLGQPISPIEVVYPHSPDYPSLSAFPYAFAANRLPPPWKRTLPIGLDVEVCSFEALEQAWKEAQELHQREHVMPYLYEGVSFPENMAIPKAGWYIQYGVSRRGFPIALLNHTPDYGSLRWTVDTPADLEFVRQVMANFGAKNDFSWQDVLALLEHNPGLSRINAGVQHKSAFDVDERQAGAQS
jgi:spore coat polysaccharide biosynthesis protein SpsF